MQVVGILQVSAHYTLVMYTEQYIYTAGAAGAVVMHVSSIA